eukprot:CAMPEP_0185826566 /NCGR_PEP_ID=MMETSP1322-20130828/31610_1 /TAXON_ID=265543 /ORGANISM="Minutocellus polymorphus, Strain RCC2270" /LENGTH=477 /DNA_ID=CAMNT_0028524295 /DNA_START=218 /DNA_END=1651 /DNA_ORIENTATION=-
MAMILLLDSLSRCLNGTSNRGGANKHPHFPSSDEPAEVQVRLRDRYSRSKGHDQQRRRRRSATPKNRNGRRPEEKDEEEENHLLEELISATTTAQQDDVDALADARRDAHAQARSSSPQDNKDESTSSRSPGRLRRRRRQRSAPKLTIEERRNGIFRLPSDHPASRPSSPANSAGEGSANANQNQSRSGGSQRGRSRSSPRGSSSPRIHMVTPEPHPVGLMCGRASPSVVFRRGGGGSGLALSHLLESRALCFASPVRDSQELAEEEAGRAAKAAAASAGANGAVDNSILLNDQDQVEVEDDPTVNTADYTYATQDDTVASTHYFEAKMAHLVETSPPMPLYRQYEVTEANPNDAIRQIVETRSHRSASTSPVQDLAGGLINVVRKKWSAAPPAQAQAPQARSPRGMQEEPTSPTGQPKATSSNDPPTPPRYPEQRARRQRSPPSTKSNNLGDRHRSDDSNSSVPSLDFSRNSSQST